MDFKQWFQDGKISKNAYELLTEQKEAKHKPNTTTNELRISVAISTHNRSSLLIRLLNSIKGQQYSNIEIVIIDDASNDNTCDTVEEFITKNTRINVSFETNVKNLGAGESRKKAYQKCSGDIIIFSDDDDYYIDPSYFSELNQLYQKNQDLTMTIASTIKYYERENKYEIQIINTPQKLTTRQYLNGFMNPLSKPNSVFTMSLRATKLKEIHFDELKCFNDTSLYLFGLLCDGYVYSISRAVGIYYIGKDNMTGNAHHDFTIMNLESKEDIFSRAVSKQLLDEPDKWRFHNLAITANYYLAFNRIIRNEDREVWRWMKKHLNYSQYCLFTLKVLRSRVKQGLPLSLLWIRP